jgi:uncharacterized damage-inducible protein DinB
MSVLAQLYRHNRWANLTLLDYCVPLGQEQLIAQAPGAHPFGAYGSLVHLVLNEEGYYETVTGEKLDVPAFDMEHIPPLPDLRPRVEAIAARYIALAGQLAEDQIIEGEWQGEAYSMPAYIPFLQCLNHSTEHREQAKASLTVAGLEPPTVDVWAWQDAGRP